MMIDDFTISPILRVLSTVLGVIRCCQRGGPYGNLELIVETRTSGIHHILIGQHAVRGLSIDLVDKAWLSLQ